MTASRILISSLILTSLVCTSVHAGDQNVSSSSRCAAILRKFALLAVAPITDAEKYVYIIGPPVGLSYVVDYPDWMAYAYVGGYFLYKKFSAKTPSTSRGALNYLLNLRLMNYDFTGKRILDVGSGYSRFGQVIDGIYGATGTEAHSIDKQVKPYGRHSVKGDALALPFPDAHFDLVVSSWAFTYWYDQKDGFTALDEMIRVTQPAGEIRLRVYRPTEHDLTIDYLNHHPMVKSYRYLRNAAFLTEKVLVIELNSDSSQSGRSTYHTKWLNEHAEDLRQD